MRKLQMVFQPLFMAGLSLRKTDKSHWANVRQLVVPIKNPMCSICGFIADTKRSLIHADEMWEFPEPPRVILSDVRPLCVNCHDAKDYADLIRRVGQAKSSASRSLTVIAHYCAVNECTYDDFDADFKEALSERAKIEAAYRWNFDKNVVVDFGNWGRPSERPLLDRSQKQLLRGIYKERAEPVFAAGKSFNTYGSAVKYLQSLPLEDRAAIILEMKDDAQEEYEDGEPLRERDEGIQFS